MLPHSERFLTYTAGPAPPTALTAPNIARRMPTLPHPAAKRFVQEAFPIGFAMRKALSIFLFPFDRPHYHYWPLITV